MAEGAVAFAKYEALGNDFLVLVDLEGRFSLSADLARAACDRHRGWGADGVLRAGPAIGGPSAGDRGKEGAKMSFELRNADGSSAEMSGNGLRCLAHAALDAGAVVAGPGDSFGVQTPAGLREVRVRRLRPGWMWASTDMGTPAVSSHKHACNVGNGQIFVDVGNPHLVVLGPDPAKVDVASLGAELSDELGRESGGLNIEFVALGPGRDELTMRVFERGVGETMACGTGSVAAASALRYWGRVGTKVTVHQPGGAVEVELGDDGSAVLSGPSRRVGSCVLEGVSEGILEDFFGARP